MKILLNNCNIYGKKITNILIEDNIIKYIGNDVVEYDNLYEINNLVVLPGMIDPHVHARDLGHSYKEDWISVSYAAAVGGVTSILDMPNNKPPTIDKNGLNLKREVAEKSIVNYGFNFGATIDNEDEITSVENIASIKVFMSESSSNALIDTEEKLRKIFNISKEINKPVILHCELQECIDYHSKIYESKIENHNKIRNTECAVKALELVIKLTEEIGNKVYIAHVSTKEEICMIREAKQKGLNIYCETTPHHLLLTDEILKEVKNFGKVNPPIRTKEDNDEIMKGVLDGTVDTIGSDHAPHALDEKLRIYSDAPSGFPGLETTLSLLFNEVAMENITFQDIADITSKNTAEIFSIKNRGQIKEGYYADIIVVDPEKLYKVESISFKSKAKYSPYEGKELQGKVVMTFVNGNLVYNKGKINDIKANELEYLR